MAGGANEAWTSMNDVDYKLDYFEGYLDLVNKILKIWVNIKFLRRLVLLRKEEILYGYGISFFT